MKKLLILFISFNLAASQIKHEKPCVTLEQYHELPFQPISADEKYVIGARNAGLFSSFFAVLSHLAWCERNNKIPVVYWDKASQYYQPNGYNGATNVWEYYFEPVSKLTYVAGDIQHSSYWAIDNTCFVVWDFNEPFREKAYRIIQKYIKIKPNIQKKIDTFYHEKMRGKKVIGLHVRGTDKLHDEKPLPLKNLVKYANTLADGHTRFLIATEDITIFNTLKKWLKGPAIFYDTHRSSSTQGAWWSKLPNRAEMGEEVLIEAQLLSRCDMLLHTFNSNVSCAVLCFNPHMPHRIFRADN